MRKDGIVSSNVNVAYRWAVSTMRDTTILEIGSHILTLQVGSKPGEVSLGRL